jgi:hypothetical protein
MTLVMQNGFPIDDLPELAFDHQEIIEFSFKNIDELKK